jgi:hypothetical protein
MTQTKVVRDADGGSLLPLTLARRRVIWRGAANAPVFVIQDSRDIEQMRLDVVVEAPTEAVVVVERTKRGPNVLPSTNHGFARWRIYGNNLAERGIWARATVDENNEHLSITGNTFYGIARPIVLAGQQSKGHSLIDNVFEGFDVAVTSDSGFTWIGKTAAVGRLACELTRVGEPVSIRDVGFEACRRLLETAGPTTAAQSVTLDDVRYEADQLHADGHAIVLRHAGALLVVGGRYGGGRQRVPRIGLLGTGEQTLETRGVTFGAFGAYRVSPVAAQNPDEARVTASGLVFQRDENDPRNTQSGLDAGVALVTRAEAAAPALVDTL